METQSEGLEEEMDSQPEEEQNRNQCPAGQVSVEVHCDLGINLAKISSDTRS
jgi:hypothetical protein